MTRVVLSFVLLFVSMTSFAGDFDLTPTVQADFEAITKDVTAALNYKAVHPAETNGLTGFGIAAIVAYTPTEERDAWRRMTGSDVDALGIAGLRAVKGLPFGLDVGAFYTVVPSTDAKVYGAEIRYAVIDGGVATPAVTLRGALTRMSGVDDFEFETRSLDLSVSKGFTFITPYAGVGKVQSDAKTKGTLRTAGIRDADHSETRTYVGVRFGLGLFDITPEYEHIGKNDSFNLLIGLSI